MPYTKSYTYVTGDVVIVTDQDTNDEDAKIAVNQGIVTADIADETFDYDSIQRGELDPIVNHHTFTTGDVFGRYNGNETINRAYFTSETKANNQTGPGSIQYQDIYETGDRFYLEASGAFFYTVGLEAMSLANGTSTGGDGIGLWDSKVLVRYTNETTNVTTYLDGTKSYTFEEAATTSSGSNDPGSGGIRVRRWIGFEWMVTSLSAGWYHVCVVVNPKVETGYFGARTFTLETFLT